MAVIVGDIDKPFGELLFRFNFHGFGLSCGLGGWDIPVGEQNLPRPPVFDLRKVFGSDQALGVSWAQNHVVVTPEQLQASV